MAYKFKFSIWKTTPNLSPRKKNRERERERDHSDVVSTCLTTLSSQCGVHLITAIGMSTRYLSRNSSHRYLSSCGNVASILELDENLRQEYKVFVHAPSVSFVVEYR